MADARPERLRLFLDATGLVKAVSFPRLPFEVVRLGLRRAAVVVLSPLVIESARLAVRRLYPTQANLLEHLLASLTYEAIPDPEPERVAGHRALCRDESDVPVA